MATTEPAARAGGIANFFRSHPTGFWFFFWGEFAERCSYYGMRAILTLYMTDKLGINKADATTYMSFFIAGCYFLPLLGGYLADNFFGKYWTIVGFSLPYIVGQLIVGIENKYILGAALVLLAMGSGVIKPNISTLMGLTYNRQRPGDDLLRTEAFSMFYFAINVGAALSQLALPSVRNAYGYQVAFLIPAIFMTLALLIFAAGKRFYAVENVGGGREEITPEERSERWVVLGRLGGLFVLVMFFWAIFDQSASTWIYFAETYMDCRIFGQPVSPDQIQALNPVFILIFLPLVTILWRVLAQRGIKILATNKMIVGFLLTAITMGVMALAGSLAGPAQEEMRFVLKEGEATFTAARVVFNESVVDVRDGKLSATKGDLTLKGGTVVTSGGPVALTNAREQFANGAEIKGDEVVIERGKVFVKQGTVTLPAGSVTLKDGKGVSADGGLVLKDNNTLVETADGAAVLKEDKYTLIQDKVSVWWKVLAFVIITVAEILISVTGLQLAFDAAPKSMTGFVTACWLATVGMANLFINASVGRLYNDMPPAQYFGMLSGTLLVVTVAFFFIAQRFNQPQAPADVGEAEAAGAADPV